METDYIAEAEEALEMLGKGYNDEPSLVIEPERTVIERRQGELKEAVIPAFVKISTSFKAELEKMDGKSLKVWLYIALSINRNTGRAHPGLRTIARDTGMGVNTVQDCLKELEEMKLLHVDRKSRKFNIYEPTIYVSANRVDPVSGSDTDGKSVSEKPESVSENRESVSASQILNQRNQREPENATASQLSETEKAIKDLSIENQIFLGKISIQHSRTDEIKNALRKYFRLTPRWSSRFDKQWLEWALDEDITPEQIKAAADLWRMDKRFNWAPPNLKGIAEHWLELKGEAVSTSPMDSALAWLKELSNA